ncbi:MAG: hypothetical protein QOI10_3202 [Solirubrobacterales bacterium]|nr:hypothetical protein [Solirubrobacterales bacterium]
MIGVLVGLLAAPVTASADDATGAQRRAISKAFFADHPHSQFSITAVRAEGNFGLVAWSTGSGKRRPGSGSSYYEREGAAEKYAGVVERDVPKKVKKKLNAPLVFDFVYAGDAHYVQNIHDTEDENGAVYDSILDAPIEWQAVYRKLKVPLTGVPGNYFIFAESDPLTLDGVIYDLECPDCALTHEHCTGFTEVPPGSNGNVHSPPGLNDDEFLVLDFEAPDLWNLVSMTTEIPSDPDLEPLCREQFENQPALMDAELQMPDLLEHNAVMSLARLRAAKVGQELSFPVGEQGGQPTRDCSSSRRDRCEQYFQGGGWHAELTGVRMK